MDLLAFDRATLYYDEAIDDTVLALIKEAGEAYGEEAAATLLARARALVPDSLLVRVALYRYFFYQHRLDDALDIAYETLSLVGKRLNFPDDWRRLGSQDLGRAAARAMGLLRFHLNLLKAAGYLELRRGRLDEGRALLEKLVELDRHDRLGGRALLALLEPEDAAAA